MHFAILPAVLAAIFLSACVTTTDSCEPPPEDTSTAKTETRTEARDRLIARLREHSSLSVQPLDDGALLVLIRSGGAFAARSAAPSPLLTAVLDHIAGALAGERRYTIVITGHTDNAGSVSSRNALSEKRAEAARLHLIDQGLDAAALFADGKGGETPLVSNATRDGRDVNRRVDLLIRPLRP
jgi:flagellar motor protein MotB